MSMFFAYAHSLDDRYQDLTLISWEMSLLTGWQATEFFYPIIIAYYAIRAQSWGSTEGARETCRSMVAVQRSRYPTSNYPIGLNGVLSQRLTSLTIEICSGNTRRQWKLIATVMSTTSLRLLHFWSYMEVRLALTLDDRRWRKRFGTNLIVDIQMKTASDQPQQIWQESPQPPSPAEGRLVHIRKVKLNDLRENSVSPKALQVGTKFNGPCQLHYVGEERLLLEIFMKQLSEALHPSTGIEWVMSINEVLRLSKGGGLAGEHTIKSLSILPVSLHTPYL
ncbi:hypothetical protein P691DRAFT_785493 [Macrolepiota fuliginosa MF-IS2]|uniref:Uncharacterized protein n=1 Tax=Macrolepiota fuliginosa MF-IS2 TaxID=1400762 RepID=A0A9P5X706_9AGAR|nr:hypothetical protein P691DRAFT_785493 [Macrolepiota fuliginosa MF-IS2]